MHQENPYKSLILESQRKKLLNLKNCKKELRKLYKDAYKEELLRIEGSNSSFISNKVATSYAHILKKRSEDLDPLVLKILKKYIIRSSTDSISSHLKILDSIQEEADSKILKELKASLQSIPEEVILELMNGSFYKDNRSLSSRLWRNRKNVSKDIDYIIKTAIAQRKSSFELAKDLEVYLNPLSVKPFEWRKVYPHAGNKSIDYNAQRLARTSINHAYYLSNLRSAKSCPFVEAINWSLSNQHEFRQVIPFGPDECDIYASQDDYKLGSGNFPLDKVPIPHPQCLCIQTPLITKSLKSIANELKAWTRGESNPTLDSWYEDWKNNR